ncbi:MAG: F-type H+-transporting ATPase subunit beta [Alphaproteobacteria bacterium]|jgi:F-type H+-transporting ATPase subunit beta
MDNIHTGRVISIRSSVVDVWFDDNLPLIFHVLHTGQDENIILEVLYQLDTQSVRCIALTATSGLARGVQVINTQKPLTAPVDKKFYHLHDFLKSA